MKQTHGIMQILPTYTTIANYEDTLCALPQHRYRDEKHASKQRQMAVGDIAQYLLMYHQIIPAKEASFETARALRGEESLVCVIFETVAMSQKLVGVEGKFMLKLTRL